MIDVALIEACAPNVAVETVQAIIQVESEGDPLALASNRPTGAVRFHPKDIAEAVQLAMREIRAGNSVDMGWMQVNSKNLRGLGLTVPQVFTPCTNLRAGAQILTGAYVGAAKEHGEGQAALRAALSAYNTGDFVAGFNNGYVARYYQRDRTRPLANNVAEIYSADPTVFIRNLQESAMSNATKPITVRDTNEFLTKGVQIELDPETAEAVGAIEEHAISEADAWESQNDPSQFDLFSATNLLGQQTNVIPFAAFNGGIEHHVVLGPTATAMSVFTSEGSPDGH